MKEMPARLLAILLGVAVLILWCISIGVTYSAAGEPALPEQENGSAVVVYMQDTLGVKVVGILGWCLVGMGFLGVALTVALGGKPKRKSKAVYASRNGRRAKIQRSGGSMAGAYRYRKNIQRRGP